VSLTDTPRSLPPSPSSLPTLPKQLGSNTETKPEINSESNSESSVADATYPNCDVLKRVDPEKPKPRFDPRKVPLVVQKAMIACGSNSDQDIRIFKTVTKDKDVDLVLDEIDAFTREVRQGEHKNANSLAKILTTKLRDRVPKKST